MNCPNCKEELHFEPTACIPKETTFALQLEAKGKMLQARTVGESITNTAKLLALVAKDMGHKCDTFLQSIELKDGKIEIRFAIVRISEPKE